MTVNSENIRKITVTGRETYAVTFPKDMIKRLGWRKGQRVVFELKQDYIVIRDYVKGD